MTTPNSNECYFKVDTTIDGNLSAANITTFDTQAKSVTSAATFSVNGNATVKSETKVLGHTYCSKYSLNATGASTRVPLDLNGNRLSNAALPTNECEPVPACYLHSPEFYFTTIPEDARITFQRKNQPLELVSDQTIIYQSRNSNRVCRIVNYDQSKKQVTYPGRSYIQLIAKGTYTLSFGISKRPGANNGWGSPVYLNCVGGLANNTTTPKVYSNSTLRGGGGYAEQATLGTTIQVTNPAPDPNAILTDDYTKHIFYLTQDDDFSILNAFYFSILFYPLDEYLI